MYELCESCDHKCAHHYTERSGFLHTCFQSCQCTTFIPSGRYWTPDPLIIDLQFVAIRATIMRGGQHIATARSHTMAKRIANALNRYIPSREGV
jgi:hypothetical protein